MSIRRKIPERRNPLLQDDHTPPVEVLIERRGLGTVNLTAKPGLIGTSNATLPKNLGRMDYLHLVAPLPKDLKGSGVFPTGPARQPEKYYLMRRSHDGYVSTSGMFRATFPWASNAEEELERTYLAASTATDDQEEIAGNLWSTPEFALYLASEYGIYDWIVALLSPHRIHDADPSIAIPPAFNIPQPKTSANGNMSTRRTASRDLRSVSPAKHVAPANRPKATPRKRRAKKSAATPSVADSVASDIDEAYEFNGVTEDQKEALDEAIEEVAEDAAEAIADAVAAAGEASEESEPLAKGTVRVSVVEDVVDDADGNETTSTNVKVELPAGSKNLTLPTDTEGVIEMARDIIANAKELEGTAENTTAAPSKKSSKRKAAAMDEDDDLQGPEEIVQEIAEGAATELTTGEVELHGRPAKRTRVMVPAEEYRREKVKRRALMGLSGALAVGVMIPFLQNLL